jgi:tetratricopeptide (TPR) repeat protein
MKKRNLKFIILAVFVLFGGVFYGWQIVSSERMSAEEYNQWITDTYDFRFGKDKPFLPSNANTFNGKFINREDFISAERCAKCHTDAHPQWKQSAHANSFREPFYQKNVKDLISQRNIAYTRHCEACHNPAALFSGVLTDKPQFKNRPFDNEGVSCISCHSIESANGRGVGGYVMGQPALLQKEDGTKIVEATDQQILDDVPSHKRAMMREVLKKPEFCASCHKSQVPKELNDYKFLRAFSVGDELQMSSFSKESPHPFYVRNKETCNTCHMKQEPTKYFDASAKSKGTIAGHRWATANTAIPTFYKFQEQLDEVVKFLQDDKLGIDIFALRRQAENSKKDQLIAPVNHKNFSLKAGDTLTADVVITNKNIGHSFPPELRDFYEAYVEFCVDDASGKTLYKSGFIKPDGYLDENAHSYKTWLVKADGTFNDLHHIWRTKTVAHNLQIQSGRSDVARYKFSLPKDLSGQIKLTAKLKYRRFTRVFSDYSLGKQLDYPIITMAASERLLNIGENQAQPVDPKAMPDWRRWNNYGIALLDNRQFPQSADAFDEVIDLKPADYQAFANTNKAIALMEMQGWPEAEKLINKALELDPNNLRALFQRGRINRVRSRLDKAEADFKKVLELYPRDRLTLQQLGELAKIKSDSVAKSERETQLKIAQGYYEQILAIDPEDTGSHYNLMIIYQKLGLRDQAKQEAKVFQDLKDDPQVTSLASNFLQTNAYIAKESLPYHAHEMKLFQPALEKSNYTGLLK